jgi:hypothetical protein
VSTGFWKRPARHGEQVRVKAEEGGLSLDDARGLEQALPLLRVGPSPLEVGEEPGGAFDSHQLDQIEACLSGRWKNVVVK